MSGKKAQIFPIIPWKKEKCVSKSTRSVSIGIILISIMVSLFWANSGLAQVAVTLDNYYCVTIVDDQAWAAGYHGSIIHFKEQRGTWSVQSIGTSETLLGISFIDGNHGWIVGETGTVIVTNNGGKTWGSQKSNIENDLFGVSFVDKNQGWACGIFGTVLHTKDGGKNWKNQSLPEDIDLYSIFFIDHQQGWAAGEFGIIFHTIDGGKTWTKQKTPIEISPVSGKSQCLFKIRFADQLRGWVSGIDGQILQTTDGGQNWHLLNPVTKRHLFGLCLTQGGFVAVGAKGTLVYGGGSTPKEVILSNVDFNDIAIKGKLGLIVGTSGRMYYSSDGGHTWEKTVIVLNQTVQKQGKTND